MKRTNRKFGRTQLGFTIVETMVVLGVTGLMFLSAIVLIDGKQRSTEFQTSLSDIRSSLQRVANDVASGYFPHSPDFGCYNNGTSTVVTNNTTYKGNCAFLGKAVHFYNSSVNNGEHFSIYTLIGTARDTTDISATQPVVVAGTTLPADPDVPDVTENPPVSYGLTVTRMTYTPVSGAGISIGSFALVQSLNPYADSTSFNSGGGAGQHVTLLGFTDSATSSLQRRQHEEAANINNMLRQGRYQLGGNIEIAFKSEGVNKCGLLTVSTSGGSGFDVSSRVTQPGAGGVC